jgi:hypothetical protein
MGLVTVGIALLGWFAAVLFYLALCVAAKRGERPDAPAGVGSGAGGIVIGLAAVRAAAALRRRRAP